MTYYFFQNLHSRIKFVNELSADKDAARNSIIEISKWAAIEKPKVRGCPPKKPEPLLKPSQHDFLE